MFALKSLRINRTFLSQKSFFVGTLNFLFLKRFEFHFVTFTQKDLFFCFLLYLSLKKHLKKTPITHDLFLSRGKKGFVRANISVKPVCLDYLSIPCMCSRTRKCTSSSTKWTDCWFLYSKRVVISRNSPCYILDLEMRITRSCRL